MRSLWECLLKMTKLAAVSAVQAFLMGELRGLCKALIILRLVFRLWVDVSRMSAACLTPPSKLYFRIADEKHQSTCSPEI